MSEISTAIAKSLEFLNPGSLDKNRGPYPTVADACKAIPNVTKLIGGVQRNLREGKIVDIGVEPNTIEHRWLKSFEDGGLVRTGNLVKTSTVVTSENLQNPADILDYKYVQSTSGDYNGQGTANLIDFAGKVYFAEVEPSTTYTIENYTWPEPEMPLVLRLEDKDGNKTAAMPLLQSGRTVFTTTDKTVKVVYSIQRYDVASRIKPYDKIMLLLGDRTTDAPKEFIPYSSILVENRVTKINDLPIESKYLRDPLILSEVNDPRAAVSRAYLASLSFVDADYLESKGYSVADVARSANLQNPSDKLTGIWINYTTGAIVPLTGGMMYFKKVKSGGMFTLSNYHHPNYAQSQPLSLRIEDALGNLITWAVLPQDESPYTFQAPSDCTIIYGASRPSFPKDYSKIMLNSGNVALPYEAYFDPYITGLNGNPVAASILDGPVVINAGESPDNPVTHKQLEEKGYGVPDVRISTNLQNPTQKKEGKWINQTTGAYVDSTGEVFLLYQFTDGIAGQKYTLSGYHHPQAPSQQLSYRMNVSPGGGLVNSAAKGLLPLDESPFTFTWLEGMGEFEFSVYRGTNPKDYSKIMLNVGDKALPFESFANKYIFGIGGIPLKSTNAVNVITDILSFANSEKIIVPGCSYVEGGGIAVKDKNWINKFSEYTNFQVINYGVGGNTFAMITDRIRKNNAPIYTNRGIGFRDLGARFATVQNLGNETTDDTGANTDTFRKHITDNVDAILASGCFPVFSTDWITQNPFISEVFRNVANECGSHFHDISVMASKILTQNVPAEQWWGTHPNMRGNNFTASEEIYQWSKLYKPGKSIKVFRKRTQYQVSNIQDLNFNNFIERARKLKEITVGNRALTETSEENGWGYMDRCNQAASYVKSTTYTDEYIELLSGNPVNFNLYAIFEITLDKIKNKAAEIYIKTSVSSGAKFYLKDYFNSANYGGLSAVPSVYADGYYKISLSESDLIRYVKYDNIKLIVEMAGAFTISDFYITYSGGIPKQEQKVWFEEKKIYTEKISVNTFDTNWTTSGGWTTTGGLLTQMSAAYRDYPTIGAGSNHISLGYDVNDVPHTIKKTITVTPKISYRKAVVRVIARLFPKLYRPDIGETSETTAIRLITPDSYDQGQLCLGIKGTNISNVFRQLLFIGWTELYFEFEIPPYTSTFELSLFRDAADIIDKVNYKNHTYPANIYFVSCQIEGE